MSLYSHIKPLLRKGEKDRIDAQNITSVLLIIISYGRWRNDVSITKASASISTG
jgi:hypothetical protein